MASGVPGFVGDLRDAVGALRRYDDGRNFPIPAYWGEETRRFGGTAQQRQTSGQPTPVFSRGLALHSFTTKKNTAEVAGSRRSATAEAIPRDAL